jgi:hypothetical protein
MIKLKTFLSCAILVIGTGNLFSQTSYTWSGGTGDWNTGANWTPAGVPGELDTAIINSGTVSLTDNATIAKLEFSADLRGDSNLVINNMMIWNNGLVQGTGSVTISEGATLRLIGGNQQTLRRNLVNNGITIWEAGHFALFDGIVFDNNGSFLDQHAIGENLSGGTYGCSFNNNGTYTKTGDCLTGIALPFYNNGILNLEIGNLNLNSYGTSSGSINIDSGFLLKIQGTSWDISGPVSGEGTVEFWAATTIRGNYNITGSTVFSSNTTIFDTSATIVSLNHGQQLGIWGTAEFNTGDPLTLDSLYLNGQLQGSDSIAIMKSMIWAGKTVQGSGTFNITSEAILRLTGGNQQTLRRNLVNNGTTIWEAGNFALFDGITCTNNAIFIDQHSGTEPFSGGLYGCSFINNGTYTKTGTGESSVTIPFHNNGSLELENGNMNFNYSGNSSGSITVGSESILRFQGYISRIISGPVDGDGTIEFSARTTTIQGIYNITGSTVFSSNTTIFDTSATIVSLNHGQQLGIWGTAEFNTGDPLTIDSLYLAGTLDGSDSVAILESMNWAAQVLRGSGGFNITEGATLRLTGGNQQTLRRNLVNNGTMIWEAGNFALFDGITCTNNAIFIDQHSGTEPFSGGLYGCSFINNGTYTKTGSGLSQLSLPLYNTTSGDIRGVGSISLTYGFSNQGSVSPGDSLGTLNLTTDYPTVSTSELNIEIGGTEVDSLYDQLNINGQASLGGTLNITLVNDFVPVLGDTFVIMTYNSFTGEFSDINGLNTGSGVSFEVNVGSTDIKLFTIETPNSAPSVFSLLAPVDKVILSKIDTLNFLWQASSDADEDMLHYTLKIFGGNMDTTIADIIDTTFQYIDKEIWQGDTEYKWTVSVSDEKTSTASPDTFSFTTPILDAISENNQFVPKVFALDQNYPNPFNPSTTIEYQLPATSQVELSIYNALGQKVETMVSKKQPVGTYKVKWDGTGLVSGVYFYRLSAQGTDQNFIQTKKLVLLK